MASKDDDNTPISSPIPGSLQHETPMGSVQSPTPLVYPPPSQTIDIIPSPSMASPSIPPPRPQNPTFTGMTEQKQQNSWDPSMPYAQRRSPDLNHQGMLSPITPFMPPLSAFSGSFPDTPADDAAAIENRNASANWGPAIPQVNPAGKVVRFESALPSAYPITTDQNRHSSWDPSMPHAYRGRPDLNDQGTQGRPSTPFIPLVSPPSRPSFDTPNHWGAGVSTDYHNSGWSSANYQAPGSPADDRHSRAHSHAGSALRYDRAPPSPPSALASYPMLRPPANDREWVTPSGAGAALRYDGVRNAGAALGMASPWVGMATRDDEAVTSAHPITNPSWAVHVYSQKLQITGQRLRRYQIVRSKLGLESQLNDLFSGSLGVWFRCFFSKKLQD